jgi:hypothetical protein
MKRRDIIHSAQRNRRDLAARSAREASGLPAVGYLSSVSESD